MCVEDLIGRKIMNKAGKEKKFYIIRHLPKQYETGKHAGKHYTRITRLDINEDNVVHINKRNYKNYVVLAKGLFGKLVDRKATKVLHDLTCELD